MCVAGEKVEVFFFPPKNYEMRLGRWCPGRGSIGGRADNWGTGAGSNPISSRARAPSLLQRGRGARVVLRLRREDANFVIICQVSYLRRPLFCCHRMSCVVLAVDGTDRKVFVKVKGSSRVHVLLSCVALDRDPRKE